MPIADIVSELQSRGVDVLIDGAHAAGMLPLDLSQLNAAYYTGNCHKWLCAPKGAGFLIVREDRRERVHPTTISHGMNAPLDGKSRFQMEFDWTGTQDPTAYLSIAAAIKDVGSLLAGGWPEIMAANHQLAVRARELVLTALGQQPACPAEMLGSIASIPLPSANPDEQVGPFDVDRLQDRLYREHQIEIPIFPFPKTPQRMMRLSAHIYNCEEDYLVLAEALAKLLRK